MTRARMSNSMFEKLDSLRSSEEAIARDLFFEAAPFLARNRMTGVGVDRSRSPWAPARLATSPHRSQAGRGASRQPAGSAAGPRHAMREEVVAVSMEYVDKPLIADKVFASPRRATAALILARGGDRSGAVRLRPLSRRNVGEPPGASVLHLLSPFADALLNPSHVCGLTRLRRYLLAGWLVGGRGFGPLAH